MATPEETVDLLVARLNTLGLRADLATSTEPGTVRLAGDLSGTATAPTVPGLTGKVPVGTGTNRVYIRDGSGTETTTSYSSAASASTIMFRTTGGVTSVGTPTSGGHATTKQYVDDADALRELSANKGAANGYAPLDSSSLVPAVNLPSYVDDVLEYANLAAFPGTGVTGKIYVAVDTGKIYRWSGSVYVEISPSPGSTDSVTEGSSNLYFTNARAVSALTSALAGKVDTTRTITAGTGLTGGGDLSANRTLTVAYGTTSTTAAVGNDSRITGAVQNTRQVVAGTGLTGGGDLTADRTLTVAYGTSSTTACVGNDARLSDTRTPATGTQFYDPTINGFAATTVRAVGAGDFPMGIKLQRACTFTSVTFRVNTADASGNLVVELRKNGTAVSGTSTTIAAASQVAGGTSTGSWAFAAGDILTVYITGIGTTPGTGLVADLKGTA